VWDRIAPGLASQFDSPYSIPLIAPRPLLILNGSILLFIQHFQIVVGNNIHMQIDVWKALQYKFCTS
jgi:hypothetical protein